MNRIAAFNALYFGRTDLVNPDVIGLTAHIVLPGTELTEHSIHCKILSVRRIRTKPAFGRRNVDRNATFRRDSLELRPKSAETPLFVSEKDFFSVRTPTHHYVVRAHTFADHIAANKSCVCDSFRFTAFHRHCIDFCVSVKLSCKCDSFAIRRDARKYFISHIGCQFLGLTSVDADTVEIACITEDNVVAPHCGESEKSRLVSGCLHAYCQKGNECD